MTAASAAGTRHQRTLLRPNPGGPRATARPGHNETTAGRMHICHTPCCRMRGPVRRQHRSTAGRIGSAGRCRVSGGRLGLQTLPQNRRQGLRLDDVPAGTSRSASRDFKRPTMGHLISGRAGHLGPGRDDKLWVVAVGRGSISDSAFGRLSTGDGLRASARQRIRLRTSASSSGIEIMGSCEDGSR